MEAIKPPQNKTQKMKLTDTILIDTRDTNNIADLRRPGIGGATNTLTLRIYGEELRCWVSVGDEAQAIKRIEQALHDAADLRTNGIWRTLYLAGATGGTGMSSIMIADKATIAAESERNDLVVVSLGTSSSRQLAGVWLKQDLGQFGTNGK